jgi:hypothetical protein
MGKITLTNFHSELKIQFPKELIFLIGQSKVNRFNTLVSFNNATKVLTFLISDIDYIQFNELPWVINANQSRNRKKRDIILHGYTTSFIRNTSRYGDCLDDLAFCVNKGKGYTICGKIELDYTIYQNSNDQILITSSINLSNLQVDYNYSIVNSRLDNFHREIYKIVPSINKTRLSTAIKDVDEIYYFQSLEGNNINYMPRDKYAYAVYKGQHLASLSTGRTMGIGKFFKDHFPEISESTINAHIEYNKMLSSYDPNLFSIVSGDDIVKYYLENSYFRMTGELGSSCMRNENKSHVIEFYAKNPNFRLLIMKAGETDSIMARALLVTTTDGTVFMDRIYTVDTKVISSFHKYAKANGIENIYEHRTYIAPVKNLFTMGPGNWTKEYLNNYTVDLQWLPDAITKINRSNKYQLSRSQQSSITNSYDVPYIDNFQYINPFTMQASVNRLNFFVVCDLSGELIDNDYVYYSSDKLYDQRFVDTSVSPPVLLPDVVTLDNAPVVSANETVTSGDDVDFDFSNYRTYPSAVVSTNNIMQQLASGEISFTDIVNQLGITYNSPEPEESEEEFDEEDDEGYGDLEEELTESEPNPYTIEGEEGQAELSSTELGIGGIISDRTPITSESTTALVDRLVHRAMTSRALDLLQQIHGINYTTEYHQITPESIMQIIEDSRATTNPEREITF